MSELTHNRVNIQTKFFRRNVFQKCLAIMKAFEQVHMSRLSNLVNCFNFLLIKFYRHIGNGFFLGGWEYLDLRLLSLTSLVSAVRKDKRKLMFSRLAVSSK